MKKSIKGAVFSGLVFPGAGQVMLGRKGEGLVFILATTVAIFFLIYSAFQRIPVILERLMPALERGSLNLAMIFEETHRVTASGSDLPGKISLWIIIGCWLLSSVHAYLVGRKMDADSRQAEEIV